MMAAPVTRIDTLPHRIHLVGIGGSGMSAIARILCLRGHRVTGSDLRESDLLGELRELGAQISIGHRAEQVGDAELVMISSAVPPQNPEVRAARARDIPVLERRGFIGALLHGYRTIAVAGTHGKTTTSAMIAHILRQEGQSPSYIVGGTLINTGANADAGRGDCFVIEADEYARMFLGLTPTVAVVTNIEMDHPDCFADIDDLRGAFEAFLGNVAPGGLVVACGDYPQARRAAQTATERVLFYGEGPEMTARVSDIAPRGLEGLDYTLNLDGQAYAGHLGISGRHNAFNAAAAITAAREVGVPVAHSMAHLASYAGVERRAQLKGEAGGVVVIDDYAHHPTHIRATISAMRERYPERRILVVFQPHTYSRTRVLFDEYAASFGQADVALILDIYRARAKGQVTLSAADLVQAMAHEAAHYVPTLDDAEAWLAENARQGDLVLTLGAGDGYLIGERLLQHLREQTR